MNAWATDTRPAGRATLPRRGRWPLSDEERFWNKVRKTATCWLWQGATSRSGYGRFRFKGQFAHAHRVAYLFAFGPIPDGCQIDHVKDRGCTSRACVNPAHLESVTPQINNMRSTSPTAINGRKTHCIHGHEFTLENTRITARGRRNCRACQAACLRRSRARRREERATSAGTDCPDGGAVLVARLVGPRPDPAYLDRLEAAYGLQAPAPPAPDGWVEARPGVFLHPGRIADWCRGAPGAGEGS